MAIVREDGVSLSTVNAAPSHFMLKIQSVSLLTQYKIQKYTSTLFEAGGYKWKLIFYPNGNRVKDHISMHLAVADTGGFQPGWEVHAVFRLFLLDQNNDTYFVVQDAEAGKGRRFRGTMREWGFERFISLTTRMRVYPKGMDGKGTHLSLSLHMDLGNEANKEQAPSRIYAEFTLRLIDERRNQKNFTKKGVSLSTTDVAPSHFMFKIQSVSLLTEYNVKKCSSAEFEAGGYKWKLIFYPNGNKRNHVTDHISVHLALMADTRSRGFQPGWEVHAVFRLFLLDRNNDTYLVIRDAQEKGRRFRATRMEWGFDRVIPVGTFNDPSYGYVVDDVCVFGAEVYVHKDLKFYTGECLSMVKDPDPIKYPWTIFNFFVPERAYHESPTFQQWKMRVYPNGKDGKGTHVSLSLHLASGGESKEPTPSRIYAEFTLRLIDRHHHKNWIVKGTYIKRLLIIKKKIKKKNETCGFLLFV
nr:ubiquitin carboxyl-terminal hydrolase 13-like [Ipomoea batatas]